MSLSDLESNTKPSLPLPQLEWVRDLTPVQAGIDTDFLRPGVKDKSEHYREAVHAMASLSNGVLTTAGAYSPRRLLRSLLCSVKCIYKEAKRALTENKVNKSSLDAESFLPILTYVMVHANLVSPCRTAFFLDEFITQYNGRTGEESYYLCSFHMAVAAVCVNMDKNEFIET